LTILVCLCSVLTYSACVGEKTILYAVFDELD